MPVLVGESGTKDFVPQAFGRAIEADNRHPCSFELLLTSQSCPEKSLAQSHRVLLFQSVVKPPPVTVADNSWEPSSFSFFFSPKKMREKEREKITKCKAN